MVVGILQFELLIRGAQSIKDKRRVVSSVKDRLHREHQVSVAEVGLLDSMHAARLALALVSGDGRHCGQVLDRISVKLRALPDAQVGEVVREVLHDPRDTGRDGPGDEDEPPVLVPEGAGEIDAEMIRRAGEVLP